MAHGVKASSSAHWRNPCLLPRLVLRFPPSPPRIRLPARLLNLSRFVLIVASRHYALSSPTLASSFTSTTSQIGEGKMKTLAFWSRIIVGQVLAGIVTLVTVLLFTQPSLAGGDVHRALQLPLDKGIITQQEYDQAVEEEQRAKVEEE